MCFEYEIPQKEEQKKAIEREKKLLPQQPEAKKAEEKPIAA